MDIVNYLNSTDAAAKRTRFTVIVLVVACVLNVVGVLNSYSGSWIHQRIATVARDKNYVAYKLGYAPHPDAKFAPKDDDDRLGFALASQEFSRSLIRGYVDNVLTVRVPFFGVGFDVNDLSLIGGIGLVAILGLLWYGLRCETIALHVGFLAAQEKKVLPEFFDVLAGRQVFTTPALRQPPQFLLTTAVVTDLPRCLVFLPVVVYGLIFVNDIHTIAVGMSIHPTHMIALLIYTMGFFVLICVLACFCWSQWRQIDRIWDDSWRTLEDSLSLLGGEPRKSGRR